MNPQPLGLGLHPQVKNYDHEAAGLPLGYYKLHQEYGYYAPLNATTRVPSTHLHHLGPFITPQEWAHYAEESNKRRRGNDTVNSFKARCQGEGGYGRGSRGRGGGGSLVENAPVTNKHPTRNPITIILPSGRSIKHTHTCNLDIPWPPHEMIEAHIVPELAHSSLIKTKAVGRNSELSSLRGLVTYKLSYVICDVYCSQKRYLLRGRLFRAPA